MTNKHTKSDDSINTVNLQVSDSDVTSELPRATHVGELKIGDATLACAVLEDGTRVLTQKDFMQAIGRVGRPRKRTSLEADGIPVFLSANNLEPFISDELRKLWSPIPFRPKRGSGVTSKAYGYRAELLAQVCNVYLDAAEAGQLQDNQMDIAKKCRILNRGFSTVGIVALVDEVTGYQEARDRDALQKILAAYVSPELLPWTKRFPDDFYQEMFRLRKWQWSPLNPSQGPRFAGTLTNQLIYDKLPPGVLEELQRLNPVVKNERLYEHHRFLTPNIGNQHLEKHLAVVIALMRISPNWRTFVSHFNRAFRKPGEPVQDEMNFDDDEQLDG